MLDAEVRHGERNLDLEQVTECAQTRIEQNVADLGNHLAGRGVDRQRQRGFVGEQFLEHRRAGLVEDQQRVAADGAGEDLVDAGDRPDGDALEDVARG